jgi:hypothetical protein
VLAVHGRWSELALSKVVDMDVTAKYRGTLDLITSDFFGQHNYSVFASVVRTYVNILFIVISPIVIYNVRYCYESEEDANYFSSACTPLPSDSTSESTHRVI